MNNKFKNKFDVFFKVLSLILLFIFVICIALIYKLFVNVKIANIVQNTSASTSHLIKVNSGINSKIIYNNKTYSSKAIIEIKDAEIIPKLNFNKLNYSYNTVHIKIVNIFGTKNIDYKYKVYK